MLPRCGRQRRVRATHVGELSSCPMRPVRDSFDRLLKIITSGAFCVISLSLTIVAVTAWATSHWWCFLVREDSPTNVLRNVALIAGGIIAWVFAFWRSSIASQQADVAKQEHHHARFQRASELLSREGLHNSHARISGLHAFRYLIHDAPDLGLEAMEVVTSFMIQTPIDEHHDLAEFTLARMTAEFICETIDRNRMFNAASRQRMRNDVEDAISRVFKKYHEAGLDPHQPVR